VLEFDGSGAAAERAASISLRAAMSPDFEAAAAAYDRHVGRYGSQLAEGLIAAAGVRPGQGVLDVGCGPGPLTAALAGLVGAGRVAAVDPSEQFVAACRARVPGADVRVGAAERLPFEDGSFDAVLAQLVVPLMEDREAGVREMARVARPGGAVAACVWDSTTMPMLRAYWDAALAVAPERAGAFDEGRRVGYPSPEQLGNLWAAGGLTDVRTGETLVRASYRDFDDLFAPFTAGTGNSGSVYRSLDDRGRDRLRADAFRRLGQPAGGFTLTARAWWVRGEA
jgi:ubiquinone/menaquinone biosynthesis C-methylase UbiE